MMTSSSGEYSSLGVSGIVGLDTFAEILAELPDDFYQQSETVRDSYWRKVYYAAAHGEKDVTRLAGLYRTSYNSIQESLK